MLLKFFKPYGIFSCSKNKNKNKDNDDDDNYNYNHNNESASLTSILATLFSTIQTYLLIM